MNILLLILAAIFIGYSIETFHESRTKLNIVKVILFSFLVAFLASGISAYVLDKNLLTKTANFLSFDSVNGLQIKLGGTSVATTTDVSTAVDNIQIGGRSLIIYSRLISGWINYAGDRLS